MAGRGDQPPRSGWRFVAGRGFPSPEQSPRVTSPAVRLRERDCGAFQSAGFFDCRIDPLR